MADRKTAHPYPMVTHLTNYHLLLTKPQIIHHARPGDAARIVLPEPITDYRLPITTQFPSAPPLLA